MDLDQDPVPEEGLGHVLEDGQDLGGDQDQDGLDQEDAPDHQDVGVLVPDHILDQSK